MDSLALYGGTFDPPHVGHVLAVHYVLLTSPVRRVLVVPCGSHPFGKEHTAFSDRLAMCRLAFASLGDAVEVLDMEGRRAGPSYTIDTVRDLRARHPGTALDLVVGSDLAEEMAAWRGIAELRELVRLRVLPRLEENTAALENDQASPFYLPRVSSSALRELVRRGGDYENRLPRAVAAYIRERGLYADPPGTGGAGATAGNPAGR